MARRPVNEYTGSNLEEVLSDVENMVYRAAQEAVDNIADDLINTIKTRTLEGTDIYGGTFEDYGEKYGRYVKGRWQPVTLVLTGEMMEQVFVMPSETSATGRIRRRIVSTSEKGYWHQKGVKDRKNKKGSGGDLPPRPWFGVSDQDVMEANQYFEQQVSDVIRDAESLSIGLLVTDKEVRRIYKRDARGRFAK